MVGKGRIEVAGHLRLNFAHRDRNRRTTTLRTEEEVWTTCINILN